jgi:hypothetical protein
MWSACGSLSVVPWILFAQASWTTDAVPLITPAQPEVFVSGAVHDHGRLFSDDAERRSHVALRRIQRDHRVPVVIETFGSLEGRAIGDVARRRPRPLSDDGIYILMVGEGRDVAVRFFRDESGGRRTDAEQAAIREAFLVPLRAGDADGSLEQGIRSVETMVAAWAASEPRSDRGTVIFVMSLSGLLAIVLAIRHGRSLRAHRTAAAFPTSGP